MTPRPRRMTPPLDPSDRPVLRTFPNRRFFHSSPLRPPTPHSSLPAAPAAGRWCKTLAYRRAAHREGVGGEPSGSSSSACALQLHSWLTWVEGRVGGWGTALLRVLSWGTPLLAQLGRGQGCLLHIHLMSPGSPTHWTPTQPTGTACGAEAAPTPNRSRACVCGRGCSHPQPQVGLWQSMPPPPPNHRGPPCRRGYLLACRLAHLPAGCTCLQAGSPLRADSTMLGAMLRTRPCMHALHYMVPTGGSTVQGGGASAPHRWAKPPKQEGNSKGTTQELQRNTHRGTTKQGSKVSQVARAAHWRSRCCCTMRMACSRVPRSPSLSLVTTYSGMCLSTCSSEAQGRGHLWCDLVQEDAPQDTKKQNKQPHHTSPHHTASHHTAPTTQPHHTASPRSPSPSISPNQAAPQPSSPPNQAAPHQAARHQTAPHLVMEEGGPPEECLQHPPSLDALHDLPRGGVGKGGGWGGR